MLTPEQVQTYNEQGYLVLPGFSSPEEVAALLRRGRELIEGFLPEDISIFTTKNQASKTDRYFLDSASAVSFFFEEKAFDAEGQLCRPQAEAINKVGHCLHDLDPAFRAWSRSPAVAELLSDLGYTKPLPVQSMYICKPPGIGGEVVPHQDSTFLATDPPSVVGLWLALQRATVDNGCLWTLPGGHRQGVYRQFLRAPDDTVSFTGEMPELPEGEFVPVEVEAGSLVLLHGANVHLSKENRSGASRHAYSVHLVEGAPGHAWAPGNWLQRRPDLPFEPLYDRSSPAAAAAAT